MRFESLFTVFNPMIVGEETFTRILYPHENFHAMLSLVFINEGRMEWISF